VDLGEYAAGPLGQAIGPWVLRLVGPVVGRHDPGRAAGRTRVCVRVCVCVCVRVCVHLHPGGDPFVP